MRTSLRSPEVNVMYNNISITCYVADSTIIANLEEQSCLVMCTG